MLCGSHARVACARADMVQGISLKQRISLLDFLWMNFTEDSQPQLLRSLTKSIKEAQQVQLTHELTR